MTSPVNSAFEYSALPVEDAEKLRKMAGRVRHSARTAVAAIFTIGNELVSAKALLDHGRFSDWVLTECGFSPRTAERFMRVVAVLGTECDTVSFLQPHTLYKLTAKSTPKETVQRVIERLCSDPRASDGDVIDMIGRSKKLQRPTVTHIKLADAWDAASVSEREELVAKDPEAHLARAWRLSSKDTRAKFSRDPPDGRGAPTETFINRSEIPAMSDWIVRHNHNAGIYFCSNPTRARMHKRPREEHILAFQYCGLDFDPHADETPNDCWKRVFAMLEAYPLKPTLLWSTGNGVQAMWRIKPAMMLKDRAQILKCKSASRGLVQALDSDSTQSLEHLFRVCGTINHPNRVKRKAGRKVILAGSFIHNPARVYQVSDFPAPRGPAQRTVRGLSAPPGGWDTQGGILDATLYCRTTHDLAAEGRSGTAIRTACRIRDHGVSEEKCFDLMRAYWLPRCDYDWDEDEVRGKIKRAYEVALNDPGCRTIEYRLLQAREEFGHEK